MPKRKASSSSSAGDNAAGKKRQQQQTSLNGFFSSSSSKMKKAASSSASETSRASASSSYKIYCDLDGVLCDFDAGVRQLFNGRGPSDLSSGMLWSGIAKSDTFYETLPWMSDGRALWDSIRHLSPDILTGVPRTRKAREQKARWCHRELGATTNHVDMAGAKSSHEVVSGRRRESPSSVVNVITCWTKNKHRESGHMAVLIDDRLDLSDKWTENGGIFIHHINTDRTLAQLRDRGILASSSSTGEEEKKVEVVDGSDDDDDDEVQFVGVVSGSRPDTP